MLSEKDFIDLYRKYSDVELAELYTNIDGYSEEAKVAIYTIIKEKGGIERLQKSLKNTLEIEKEISRIKYETAKLCSKETSPDFIKNLITSNVLNRNQVEEIIDEKFKEFTIHHKANTIDLKTIILAIIGIAISSIVAGILWALIITQSNKVPIILMLGVAAVCYFTIILLTKKSKTNPIVIISTIIAFFFAYYIGMFLYPI